jgi:hypothetical protein
MKKRFYAAFTVICVLLPCETTQAVGFIVKQKSGNNRKWSLKIVFPLMPGLEVQYKDQQYTVSEFVVEEGDSKSNNKLSISFIQGQEPIERTLEAVSIAKCKEIVDAALGNIGPDNITGDSDSGAVHKSTEGRTFDSRYGKGSLLFYGFLEPTLSQLGIKFILGWGDRLAKYWYYITQIATFSDFFFGGRSRK